MSDMPQCTTRRLSYSEKISRLRVRLRNPEWRRYGKLLLAGKGAGIALTLGIIGVTSDISRRTRTSRRSGPQGK